MPRARTNPVSPARWNLSGVERNGKRACAWCGQDLGTAPIEEGTPRWDGFCCKECADMHYATGGARWRRLTAWFDKYVRITDVEEPKLSWLEAQFSFAGIPHRRKHRPQYPNEIDLEVAQSRLNDALEIYNPVDATRLRDDLPRFRAPLGRPYEPHYTPSPATRRVIKRTIKGINDMLRRSKTKRK